MRTCAATLKAGVANARERLSTQKSMREALAVLKGTVTSTKSLLDRFLTGEFTKENPKKMWNYFCKAFAEAKGNLQILIDPLEKFFEYHETQKAVFESARQQRFNLSDGALGQNAIYQIMSLISSGAKGTLTINLG